MADLTGNYERPSPWWGLRLSEEQEGRGGLRIDKLNWLGCYKVDRESKNNLKKILISKWLFSTYKEGKGKTYAELS